MMNRINLKKLLILNIPYILVGLFATNFGEAWRLAEGADSSAIILSFFYALPVALGNPLPSFYPLDLLVGIACGAGAQGAAEGDLVLGLVQPRPELLGVDRQHQAAAHAAAVVEGAELAPDPEEPSRPRKPTKPTA